MDFGGKTETGAEGAEQGVAPAASAAPDPSNSPGPLEAPPPTVAPDPRRGRALLVLSLTVLLWYGGVTAWRAFAPEPPLPPAGPQAESTAGATNGPEAPAASASSRPLTLRQRFLLGKKIDINRAGWKEISELPGITDGTARAVVETRARLGGFRAPGELLAVRGIKERRLEKILPFLGGFLNN